MNICSGTTSWSNFFYFCEIITMIFLSLIYFRSLYKLYKEGLLFLFEKFELLIILLSFIQTLIFSITFLIKDYFILSIFNSIFKFAENITICCLLIMTILWKIPIIIALIINYYSVGILIVSILFFLIGLFEYPPFIIEYNKPNIEILLAIIGFFANISIFTLSFIYSKKENFNEGMNLSNEDDKIFINDIFQKNLEKMQQTMKTYLYISFTFTISFAIDLLFSLFLKGNKKIPNLNEQNNNNSNISKCYYYGNFGNEFLFNQFFYCLISYIFRDLYPHCYVYLKVGISNPAQSSRSSSFIEEF
jgi:hypothetical protein